MERMASAAEADHGLRHILKSRLSETVFFCSSHAYRMRDQARSSRRSATPPFVPLAVTVYGVAEASPACPIAASCRCPVLPLHTSH
jgi:hypothetical protein